MTPRSLQIGLVVIIYSSMLFAQLEEFKIVAEDGAAADEFGASIAAWEDFLLIGTPSDDDQGSASGSVIDILNESEDELVF